MPNAADLTTLANLKLWLNISPGTTGDDAQLQRLLTAVSVGIQAWLNRSLPTATYSETKNGNGRAAIMVMNYPVTAVASVTIDGVAIPTRTSVTASGYSFDSDMIYLDGYTFNRGNQNVALTYTAGYVTIPLDLEQAAIELMAMRYKERDRIGHASLSVGGETTAFITKDMPDSVKTVLMNYRRVVPV